MVIPTSVSSIGTYSFAGDYAGPNFGLVSSFIYSFLIETQLVSVIVPSSLTSIAGGAFSGTQE